MAKQNKKRKRTEADDNGDLGGFVDNNSFNSYNYSSNNEDSNECMAEVDGGWSSNGLEDEALPPLHEIEVDTNQNIVVDTLPEIEVDKDESIVAGTSV